VKYIAPVKVKSRNRPRWVVCPCEGSLARACARALNTKRLDLATSSTHEAVKHVAPVKVLSTNRSRWGDASAERTLAGSCACTLNIKRRDLAIGSAHESVRHIAPISVITRNRPRRAEAVRKCGKGALAGARARALNINRRVTA